MTYPLYSSPLTLIQIDDYNTIYNNVEEILGTGIDGYGLTWLNSVPVTNRNRVTAQGWHNLIADINQIHLHVLNVTTSTVGPTTGTTLVSTATHNDLHYRALWLLDDVRRYTCHPSQYFSDGGNTIDRTGAVTTSPYRGGVSTSTTTSWVGEISHVVTASWTTSLLGHYFFNTGGEFVWSSFYDDTTGVNDLDQEWAAFILYIQDTQNWKYTRTQWRDTAWPTTSTYWTSGTLQISMVAQKDVNTGKGVEFTITYTDTTAPGFIITPKTHFENIVL
jgi:hypothetical protein